jgi:hypothetical protein
MISNSHPPKDKESQSTELCLLQGKDSWPTAKTNIHANSVGNWTCVIFPLEIMRVIESEGTVNIVANSPKIAGLTGAIDM